MVISRTFAGLRDISYSTRMSRIIFTVSAIVVLLIGANVALSFSEWQLNEEWQLVQTGSLTVRGPVGGTVFIDQKRVGTISESGTYTRERVLPGRRNVLVSQEGAWPWTKNVNIESALTTEVTPFLVPTAPKARVLKESDPEYANAVRAIRSATLPTPDKPLASSDSLAEVYVRDAIIGSVWRGDSTTTPSYYCAKETCGPITVLTTEIGAVRGLSFLGTRHDVLIVAVRNGVWALDVEPASKGSAEGINTSQTQNFQPLYLGSDPTFAVKDTSTIYIQDGAFFIELSL